MNEMDAAIRRHVDTLIEMTGANVRPIQGGVHVKELPGGQCVDVMRMLFNWRVVRSDAHHMTTDRGWCYEGTGVVSFIRAVVNAQTWGTGPMTPNRTAG